MSSFISGLGSIAEKSAGEALAFGLGFALGRALEPAGVGLAQTAWQVDPNKVLDPGTAAAIVAEAVDLLSWGEGEARQTGIDKERFDLLVQEMLDAPGLGELLRMLRRESINPDEFAHGLRKAKMEPRWDQALADLEQERLDPAVIATSIQRGVMHDPGVLPVGPPSEVGRVPPMPVSALDTLKEAAASGLNEERLAVLARIVGLPASPDLAARMVFREIVDRVDFDRAVSEGNTRNEWAPFLFEAFKEILTSHDYVEGRLRGWIDDTQMYAGTAKHGLSKEDTDLRFKLMGRPIVTHQVTTGLARGGTYNGDHSQIPEAYIRSLEQGNERPEWYSLSYANRYSLPSAFVLRTLATSGELQPPEVHDLLLQIGWPPDLADKVTRVWTGGPTVTVDKHVGKAQTQLWNALHKSYVDSETDAAKAASALTAAGVPEDSHQGVLAVWDQEREIVRAGLTPKQIKDAIGQAKFDLAYAMGRLRELGYSDADAATFLAE